MESGGGPTSGGPASSPQLPNTEKEEHKKKNVGLRSLLEEGPTHVVFTSCSPPGDHPLKQVIQQNTRHAWSHLGPRVHMIDFSADLHVAAARERLTGSRRGPPILNTLYTRAFELHPRADTFTYFNCDLLVDRGFLATVDAVVQAVEQGTLQPRFLVVGRRTNVQWRTTWRLRVAGGQSSFNFTAVFMQGRAGQSDAEDYFTVSRDTFHWETEVPSFMVGRPAYDNWLVDEAFHNKGVDLIDASATVKCIHQTDERGISAWQTSRDKETKEWNVNQGGEQWAQGHIDRAPLITALRKQLDQQLRRELDRLLFQTGAAAAAVAESTALKAAKAEVSIVRRDRETAPPEILDAHAVVRPGKYKVVYDGRVRLRDFHSDVTGKILPGELTRGMIVNLVGVMQDRSHNWWGLLAADDLPPPAAEAAAAGVPRVDAPRSSQNTTPASSSRATRRPHFVLIRTAGRFSLLKPMIPETPRSVRQKQRGSRASWSSRKAAFLPRKWRWRNQTYRPKMGPRQPKRPHRLTAAGAK